MQVRKRPLGLTGRRCGCGARVEPGTPSCGKCRARARWVRRKARPDNLGDDC